MRCAKLIRNCKIKGRFTIYKLSYEEVRLEYEKRGLQLLDKEYKRNNQKLSFQNANGYKAEISVANLKAGKHPQYFSVFNKYTLYNVQKYLINHKSKAVLLSNKYKSSTEQLLFLCECGEKFYMNINSLQSRIHLCCDKCMIKRRGISSRVPFSKVVEKFNENGYKLLAKPEDYKGSYTYLYCEDKDGYRGYQSYNHLVGKDHKQISKYSVKYNKENVIYNLNNYAKIHNISSVVIKYVGETKRKGQHILCKCQCGNSFKTTVESFRNGKERCDICSSSISRIELLTKHWLDKYNINYIHQYSIDECKNILSLPFDFYIPNKNLLIEVDGEGHYKPCYFNNCSLKSAKASFKKTKENDKIKDTYCRDNNLNLLRIPYWEYLNDNYKDILYNHILRD